MMVEVLGIDLAWGRKNPDAIARVTLVNGEIQVKECYYTQGDEALLTLLEKDAMGDSQTVLALDAPMICHNETGSRPVDKECNRLFRQYEAGCHPVNLSLCERPISLAQKIAQLGYTHNWDVHEKKIAMEVYPHPAMVRWFHLEKTIKYKRGTVNEKRMHFRRYQEYFLKWVEESFSEVSLSPEFHAVLSEAWSKKTEDILDAYFCAFIGVWHVIHEGRNTQILGDRESGFMVVPRSA